MGYRIQYEPELNKKYHIAVSRWPNRKQVVWSSLCVLLIGMAAIPTVRQWVLEFLIPGDARVTTGAFTQMISDLRAGEDFSDAVTVFCREILAHA